MPSAGTWGQPTGQPARQPVGQPTGQPVRRPVGQPARTPADTCRVMYVTRNFSGLPPKN
ncbi:PT domain-containing protein [Streptomyces sp. NPDC090093]|uniref:PT domain-containing protein n=1 Tax=Streptomyces sp. NPDC090093 TaxID=3365945 RepID=UPI0037FEAEA4